MAIGSRVNAAARFNRRVVIQAPDRASDGKGGQIKGWTDVSTVWAEMIPLRGQEAVAHNLLTSGQLWKVTIRYRAGLTVQHRLVLDGVPLNIRTCQDPDGRRKELVMTAESGAKT